MLIKKKLRRHQMLSYFSQLEPCIVVMEACGSCHYWCRELTNAGHEVKPIPPQYVETYRKGNTHDYYDAEARADASQRERMRFVPFKAQDQQNIRLMHLIRQRMIAHQTALINHIRGLLIEQSIVCERSEATFGEKFAFNPGTR
jgi:Transposase and inactivated derivatives